MTNVPYQACSPMLTECPRCKNVIGQCDGAYLERPVGAHPALAADYTTTNIPAREGMSRGIDIYEIVAGASIPADVAAANLARCVGKFDHKLNNDQTVAVSTEVFWNEDMTTCPRGAKVQLLGAGGVALYGMYDGKDQFFTAWAPVPRRR